MQYFNRLNMGRVSLPATISSATGEDILDETLLSTDSPLLQLPPELRNHIYRYSVTASQPIKVDASGFWESPLLATCKQIRSEARTLAFTENRFKIEIDDYDITNCHKWREVIGAAQGRGEAPTLFQDTDVRLTATSGNPNWANLLGWLKAHHGGITHFKLPDPSNAPSSTSSPDPELIIICGMFAMADQMVSQPWKVAENIFNVQRRVRAMFEPHWLD